MDQEESPVSGAPENNQQEEINVTPEQEAAVLRAIKANAELSYEEHMIWRAIRKREEEESKQWAEANGIVRQVLFDYTCQTSVEDIVNILNAWFQEQKLENPELIDGFELKNWSEKPIKVIKVIYSILRNFGGVGSISLTRVNTTTTHIKLVCEGHLLPFMDNTDEAVEKYQQSLNLMRNLARKLAKLFDIAISIPPTPSASGSTQSGLVIGSSDNNQIIGDLSEEIWERIQDNANDREIVRLWCRGLKGREIGKRLNVTPEWVYVRITYLRDKYPELHIPYRKKRKEII